MEEPGRRGVPHLGAFNVRLWAMTAAPLRHFRDIALWLFRTTASLQVGPGVGYDAGLCWSFRVLRAVLCEVPLYLSI